MMNGEPIVISDDDDENAVSSTETSKHNKPSTSSNPKQQVTLKKIYQLKEKAAALRIKQGKLDEGDARANSLNPSINANISAAINCAAVIKTEPNSGTAAINNDSHQNTTATNQQCQSKTNKRLSASQRPEAVSSSTPGLQNYSESSNLSSIQSRASSGGTMGNNKRKSTDDDDDDCSGSTEDFSANPEYSAAIEKVKQNQSVLETFKDAFESNKITKDDYDKALQIFQKLNDSPLPNNRANTSSISNGSRTKGNSSNASGGSSSARPDCSTPIGGGLHKSRQTSSIEPSRSQDTSMSSIRNVTGNENSFDDFSGKYFFFQY